MNENLLTSVIINNNKTIYDGIFLLEKNKKKFLLCIDENFKLIGTVVDGDIRRAIINKKSLSEPISSIINKNYLFLDDNSTFEETCEKFKNDKITFLPIVKKKNNTIINYITKQQFHSLLLKNVSFDVNYNFSSFDDFKIDHEIFNKPWGFYKSVLLSDKVQTKIITVFPQGELSLQLHNKREEHWVIIKGEGQVRIGETTFPASAGKYIYVAKKSKHKIINHSKTENLVFVEVQLGEYFGEDDIIRLEDKYGRI